MRRSWLLICLVLLASACASIDDGASETTTSAPTTAAPTTVSLNTTTTTIPPSSSSPTTTPTTSDSNSTTEPNPCRRIADLEEEAELLRWRIVNDGVMGGRSSAQAEVAGSVLTLTGEIVTAGGGFSSVRLDLDESLGDATTLRLRIRTDGRAYELTTTDAIDGRDPRISHQGAIPTVGTDDWEEVDVDLTQLDSSLFGRAVEVEPFDPTAAIEVGIILADSIDGPFGFSLDWIDACA